MCQDARTQALKIKRAARIAVLLRRCMSDPLSNTFSASCAAMRWLNRSARLTATHDFMFVPASQPPGAARRSARHLTGHTYRTVAANDFNRCPRPPHAVRATRRHRRRRALHRHRGTGLAGSRRARDSGPTSTPAARQPPGATHVRVSVWRHRKERDGAPTSSATTVAGNRPHGPSADPRRPRGDAPPTARVRPRRRRAAQPSPRRHADAG